MGKLIRISDRRPDEEEAPAYLEYFGMSCSAFTGKTLRDEFWPGRGTDSVVRQVREATAKPGLAIITEPRLASGSLLKGAISGRLDDDRILAEFPVPPASAPEFLAGMLKGFGFDDIDPDLSECRSVAEAFLRHNSGKHDFPVIVIEQAETLAADVFDEIGRLLKIRENDAACLQVVLIGKPELAERARSRLEDVGHSHVRLKGLDIDEVANYVFQRLNAAGVSGRSLFTPAAIKHLATLSGGVPGVVSQICHHALRWAHEASLKKVTKRILLESLEDLQISLCSSTSDSLSDNGEATDNDGGQAGYVYPSFELRRKGKHIARFDLSGDRLTIGRHKSNDVFVLSPGVSLFHAVVVVDNNGVYLFDLRSTNGTCINGRDVLKKRLCEGDVISLGAVTLTFHPGTEAEADDLSQQNVLHFTETVVLEENESSDPTVYMRSPL